MRIGLFTDTYYPEINGVANSVFQLKKELENMGNEVYVFTVSNPAVKEKETHVYRMRSVACPLLRERRMSYSFFYHWFEIIRSLKLDLIHTQTEFFVGHLGRRAAKKLNIPLIHTYHTIYEDYTHYLTIPGNQRLKCVIRGLSRIFCDHADEVIVPTEKVKNLLLSYGVQRPILVQPTGIDLFKFTMADMKEVTKIRSQYRLSSQHHILVSIGRLSKEKNLPEIIENMEDIVQSDWMARLLVVGDGPERMSCEALVKEKKLEDYVFFTGEVDWKHIQNYYAVGDVFTCASTSETQGLTYAEALACGKPLLVRKDECLKNLLLEGINGYCYQDKTGFLQSYRLLFQDNRYREMEQDAKKSVEKISSGMFGRNMKQIYMRALGKKQAKGDGLYEKIHAVAG